MDILRHKNITKRILIPVILSLAAVTGLAVVGAYWQKTKAFSQKADLQVDHINRQLETAIENDAQLLDALLNPIQKDPAIQQAWLSQDKETLLKTTKSIFQHNRSRYRVTHLYFIGLDKVVFLRGHNPTHSGDLKTKFLMQQASRTGQNTHGIELGKYGTLTLRVIHPWYIDGQLTGYIELGEEITHVLEKLQKTNNTQLLVTIDKKFLDEKKWKSREKMPGQNIEWEQFSDFIVPHEYAQPHGPEHDHDHNNEIEITEELAQQLSALQEAGLYAHTDYLKYQIHTIPLLDTAKRKVGNIFTIHDNSRTQKILHTYITILISMAILITALLSVFFFRYAKKIESDLGQSRKMAAKAANEKIETLARTNEFKSTFLANMSHEIRTPLNGISGMLQLLQETEPLTEEQKHFLETAGSSGELLMTLLNDLLDLSKAEAGKLNLENINFDIIKLSKDVTNIFQPLAQQKGISLNNIINPDAPRFINGDPTRIRQILNNLISNAIKFTTQGEVTLEIKPIMPDRKLDTLLFEIIDTGIGIDQNKKDIIFESFTQADDSTTRQYGGTGLGLTITKYLTHKMGGEIYVKSILGEGSTFSFTIPIQEVEQAHTEKCEYAQNKNIRALHISHNISYCQSIGSILREAGIAYCHENTDSCIDKLLSAIEENSPFHIVIMDTMDLSKTEMRLAEVIKKNQALKDIHLILLVRTGIRGDASTARKSGVEGYLTSPSGNQQIPVCINTIIQLSKAQQKNILVTKHLLDELKDNDHS